MPYIHRRVTVKLKAVSFIAAVTILFSCEHKPKTNTTKRAHVTTNDKALTFDIVLKCHSYSYNDGYFMTADYGCIYNPNVGNNLGNVVIYLIPKKPLDITDDQIGTENKKIDSLSADQYKKDYNIYVFVIGKQYLNYNKDGDPLYYQKDKFTETLYTYDEPAQKWNLIDSINVTGDVTKEQSWRENLMKKLVTRPKQKTTTVSSSNTISSKWYGNYTFNINEDNSDWREMQKIELTVTKDSIVYHAEGYQIDQTYLLKGADNDDTLKLQYQSAKDNTASAVLDKTKDFGTVTNSNGSYKWHSPYLDVSFRDGKATVYTLNKK